MSAWEDEGREKGYDARLVEEAMNEKPKDWQIQNQIDKLDRIARVILKQPSDREVIYKLQLMNALMLDTLTKVAEHNIYQVPQIHIKQIAQLVLERVQKMQEEK